LFLHGLQFANSPSIDQQNTQSSSVNSEGGVTGTTPGEENQESTGNGTSSTSPMLSSFLYDWSCGYFSRPINTKEESDDTTPMYIERLWRKERNKIVYREASALQQPFCNSIFPLFRSILF
jgi:hypothetical protein